MHYANLMVTIGLHMHNKVLKIIGSSYTIEQFFQRSLLAIVLVESHCLTYGYGAYGFKFIL